MKSNLTSLAPILLIAAGSMLPAYGQGRGRDHGGDPGDRAPQGEQQRGQGREQRSSQQESRRGMETQQAAPQQDRRGGGGQFYQQGRSDSGRYQEQRQRQETRPQAQQRLPQQQYQQGGRDSAQNSYQYRPQTRDSRQGSYERQRGYQEQQARPQSGYNYRGGDYRGGASFRQFSSHNWQNDRRSWSQRGGYRGSFIPQARFYGSFGRQNYFRIGRPDFYNGYPRFQRGGYSFRILDPWPDYWGDDWYDSDDVYVDYEDDGYYMYNSRYPDVGISVEIDF